MRIAFIGKGGSGKTSCAAAFARFSSVNQGMPTVAFDVDVNAHLGATLGFEGTDHFLIPQAQAVFKALEPARTDFNEAVGETPFIGCLPPSLTSKFISINKLDPFLQRFALRRDRVFLISAGSYGTADIGISCYHGKLFSSQLVAHRLLDTATEVVVFDATAGADPVATSLCLAYDLHVVVVEPTLKSVAVYQDYVKALPYPAKVHILINKVRSAADRQFVEKHLPSELIIGILGYSRALRDFEQGMSGGLDEFVETNKDTFQEILKLLSQSQRKRQEYFAVVQEWFERYAAKWYDPYYQNTLGQHSRAATEQLIASLSHYTARQ